MHESVNNIGARLKALIADYITATAASTGDNTKATSDEIDRLDSSGGVAQSCKLVIPWTTTLTAEKTLSLTVGIISSEASGSGYSAATSLLAKTVVATATGLGQIEIDVDLAPFGRYVEFEITPDLSADNTDVATLMPVVVLGGFASNPVSDGV